MTLVNALKHIDLQRFMNCAEHFQPPLPLESDSIFTPGQLQTMCFFAFLSRRSPIPLLFIVPATYFLDRMAIILGGVKLGGSFNLVVILQACTWSSIAFSLVIG
jgi:hypothetical protein